MFLRAPETHSRSFVKAVSWRILGSIDTFVISYFVTGRLVFAASIASVETFTKICLYYFHEQAWARVPWGRADQQLVQHPEPAAEEPAAAEPAAHAQATAAAAPVAAPVGTPVAAPAA
jgi:uncharacterized membrane protein